MKRLVLLIILGLAFTMIFNFAETIEAEHKSVTKLNYQSKSLETLTETEKIVMLTIQSINEKSELFFCILISHFIFTLEDIRKIRDYDYEMTKG